MYAYLFIYIGILSVSYRRRSLFIRGSDAVWSVYMEFSNGSDQFVGVWCVLIRFFEDLICPISLRMGIRSVRCFQGHQLGACMQLDAIHILISSLPSGRRTPTSDVSRSKIEAMEPSVKGILTDEKVGRWVGGAAWPRAHKKLTRSQKPRQKVRRATCKTYPTCAKVSNKMK